MNYRAAILIGLLGTQLSPAAEAASSVLLAHDECTVLDGVRESIRLGSRTEEAALDILKRVAEGGVDSSGPGLEAVLAFTGEEARREERRAAVARELEAAMALMGFPMRTGTFASARERACALRNIGKFDLPETLAYLESFRKEDFGPGSLEVWAGARIALFEARLRHITRPADRIAFLERTIRVRDPADSYAEDELCDGGSYPSLPLIRESIRSRDPYRAAERIRYCEARMEIVARNPDRVTAIGAFLKVDGRPIDRDLNGWAIRQLGMMESPRADAELERYAKELERVKDSSPDTVEAAYTLWKVRDWLSRRAAESKRN